MTGLCISEISMALGHSRVEGTQRGTRGWVRIRARIDARTQVWDDGRRYGRNSTSSRMRIDPTAKEESALKRTVAVHGGKPSFTKDQIVSSSDVQRRWRTAIENKFRTYPFVVVFSGTQPQSVVLSYDEFEALWEQAARADELEVKAETLSRLLAHASSSSAAITLPEMVAEMGISPAELEAEPDVDLEDE